MGNARDGSYKNPLKYQPSLIHLTDLCQFNGSLKEPSLDLLAKLKHFGRQVFIILMLFAFKSNLLYGSEVFENRAAHFSEVQDQGATKVVVREHPRTGRPFVSIVSNQALSQDPFAPLRKKYSRPDYRMLDAKAKTKDFAYDGPYSSSKKVYIFAASLMTLGVGAGAIGVAMPVAATSGAAGGAGAYAAGGTAVVGAVGAVTALKSRTSPEDDTFEHSSETKTIETSKS